MIQHIIRNKINEFPGKVIKKVPLPNPILIKGFSYRKKVSQICKKNKYKKVLLICDSVITKLGYHQLIVDSLKKESIECYVFDEINSEPNIKTIKKGSTIGVKNNVDCIISLGGGSVLDSGKIMSCAIKLKTTSIKPLLIKFLFIKNKSIPIISIPTTAGTGAELTVGAVVTTGSTKKSTVIVGLNIVGIILDQELIINIPKDTKIACGIDALSHGLEGCLSITSSSNDDINKSFECVKLVLNNLPKAIRSKDSKVHSNLQLAAYYGGNAINKQLAGYIHAFAHALGGKYHIPHGQAIRMSMIPVLMYQKDACKDKLYELSKYCGLARKNSSCDEVINNLFNKLDKLCKLCTIDFDLKMIKKEDYNDLCRRIIVDSINYSSPIVLDKKDIMKILNEIKGE